MKVTNVVVVSAKVQAEVELGPDEVAQLGLQVDHSTLEQLALAQLGTGSAQPSLTTAPITYHEAREDGDVLDLEPVPERRHENTV